jgi:hypothetical protein
MPSKSEFNESHLPASKPVERIFLVTRHIHSPALHRCWCILGRKAHAISADNSACLMAENVWNEGI